MGTSENQKVYRPEGKLLEPEEDSHRPGAHDTQLIDLTTEEPALLKVLGSGKPTGQTRPSNTMSMEVGRAERHLTGQVDRPAGHEGTAIPKRACTTRAGDGRDSGP